VLKKKNRLSFTFIFDGVKPGSFELARKPLIFAVAG